MTTLKKLFIFIPAALAATTGTVPAETSWTQEEQLKLIAQYKFVFEGRDGIPTEAQSMIDFDTIQLPIKCATPIVSSFAMNFDKFDKELIDRYQLALAPRPTQTNETYNSPGGHFKIHFTRAGSHSVYQSTQTTGGVPNYVIGTARVFDSVWVHEVDTLGYPRPPSDGGYPSGVDSLYDIYLVNLGGAYYGLTYPDSLFFSSPFSLDATSFVLIDNDYQESSFPNYNSNPLNAVRVTAAHEFFHAIHFAIDISEMEDYNQPLQRRYWYEMSATWMEEEVYDEINDYYIVLDTFFSQPRVSIQRFDSYSDFHPYASCVFPIFLAEKFGRDIIKPIWIKCGQMGLGPDFLEAAQLVIDSVTNGTENFRSVFGEFALWNYFTGSRASSAPLGIGYSERSLYPEIPEAEFTIVDSFPASQSANANPKNPEPNGAAYFKINNTRAISYDSCAGKAVDSVLRVPLVLGNGVDSFLPQGWHISQINQSDLYSNQYTFSDTTAPDDATFFVRIANPRQFRSVAFALAPASWKWEPYTNPSWDSWYGYLLNDTTRPECLVDSLIDTVLTIDTTKKDVEAAVLSAYPNPAVLSQMGSQNLRFRFTIPTDSISFASYSSPLCVVDIYTLAGELIKTCDTIANPNQNPNPYIRTVLFEIVWDMKSEVDSDISSGVYICVGRLFSDSDRAELLAEEKAKVLIVR